jgi:hypothetical protein
MADEPDRPVDDQSAWDHAWAAQPVRRLPGETRLDPVFTRPAEWGEPVEIEIQTNPPEFADRLWRQSEVCPVCGCDTGSDDRLPVAIYPRFTNGLSIGIGAWAHQVCLAACEPSPGACHVPW